MKIYLASKSPRRSELLLKMGVEFDVLGIDIPEEVMPAETIDVYSQRVTTEKLNAAWDKLIEDGLSLAPVLCADTEVVLDQQILGKPLDYHHAFAMLKNYSQRSHEVITSVGVKYLDYQKIAMNVTHVHFARMEDQDIEHYLTSGDYQDKAGAYGINSYIGQFISKIDGCFYSVMGLPLNTVRMLLKEVEEVWQANQTF